MFTWRSLISYKWLLPEILESEPKFYNSLYRNNSKFPFASLNLSCPVLRLLFYKALSSKFGHETPQWTKATLWHVWECRGCLKSFPLFKGRLCMFVYVLSGVRFFAAPQTVAQQAPMSRGFSRQEYWNGLPFPPQGDLPDPGMEHTSPLSPALAGRFFTTVLPRNLKKDSWF